MKATIELDLNETEDSRKWTELSKNTEIMLALWDTDQLLWKHLKHNSENFSEEQLQAIEKMRAEFFDILDYYDIKKLILEMP